MTVLHSGNYERLKAGVHGLALGTAAVCGAYNLSAWFVRRQPHLAINAALYWAVVVWEYQHVKHHIDALRQAQEEIDARRQSLETLPDPDIAYRGAA
jgi:hypothetical protein